MVFGPVVVAARLQEPSRRFCLIGLVGMESSVEKHGGKSGFRLLGHGDFADEQPLDVFGSDFLKRSISVVPLEILSIKKA